VLSFADYLFGFREIERDGFEPAALSLLRFVAVL
jgi:hypothetical protein